MHAGRGVSCGPPGSGARDHELDVGDGEQQLAGVALDADVAVGQPGHAGPFDRRLARRRNSCAFAATTIVDTLISTAPTAGDSVSPAPSGRG